MKAKICESTGLRFLAWDGMLKMYTVKPAMRENEKREYSEYLLENYKQMNEARQRRESGRKDAKEEKSDDRSHGYFHFLLDILSQHVKKTAFYEFSLFYNKPLGIEIPESYCGNDLECTRVHYVMSMPLYIDILMLTLVLFMIVFL